MYIEFAGPTGAGKSTIVSDLINHLRFASIAAITNYERNFGFGRSANPSVQNIVLDTLAFRALIQKGALGNELGFAKTLMTSYPHSQLHRLNAMRSYLRKRGMFDYCNVKYPNDLVIMDEGIVHGMHNMLVTSEKGPEASDIDAYLAHIPLPDHVVLVMASKQTLIERTAARDDRSRRLGDTDQWEAFIANAWQLFDILREHPALRNRLHVIENQDPASSQASAQNSKKIWRLIEQCSRS